ncbi:MAG: putative Lipoprotein, partial [Gammaproteobacteria bacterium]|nr:putative Lipoprotein [Gammaproteobacteria bacterium]
MKAVLSIFKKCLLRLLPATLLFSMSLSVFAQDAGSGLENSIIDAISAGKLDLNMRMRYENVDDDAVLEDANALTLRTALGYTTGAFNNLTARVLVQDVREVFVDDYNDGTGRNAQRNRYAVVADPKETDFLEAYMAYAGIANTTFKVGRQLITYGPSPLHRFIGNVGWRQNWQSNDAVTLVNKSIQNLTLSYAYSWNVNRIFTDEAMTSSRANYDSDSHFFNGQYVVAGYGTLESYVYLLDFQNSPADSNATYGVRFSGDHQMTDVFKLIYALEYAGQQDYGHNTIDLDEDYFEGEFGVNVKVGESFGPVTLKFDYEMLGGNGTIGFRTPLATLHAYQGWADRFLITPADGIDDWYFTASSPIAGFN